MSEPKRKTVFRRIRGRIVPIAVPSALGAAAGASIVDKSKNRRSLTQRAKISGLVGVGMVAQVASGLVSGLPRKLKWVAAGTAASIGLDVGSSALFAKAATMGSNKKTHQIKDFAKYQTVGAAIGWSTFGGTLLADPKVRSKLLTLGRKLVTRGK